MPTPHERLEKVAEQIKKGVVPRQYTARTLLGWFGAERRAPRSSTPPGRIRRKRDHIALLWAWVAASDLYRNKHTHRIGYR